MEPSTHPNSDILSLPLSTPTPTSTITITNDAKSLALDPLPPGFINELFDSLSSLRGESIIAMMLKSLYELTPQQQQQQQQQQLSLGNRQIIKGKSNFNQPQDLDEVKILQDFIFSNINHIDNFNFPHHVDLIFAGRLPNLEKVTIVIDQSKKQSFPWMSLVNLPKLKSLFISDYQRLRSVQSNNWNPFESLTGPIILPALENIVINDARRRLNVDQIVNTLFTHGSFPNLKNVELPSQFFTSTDIVMIKRLLNLLQVIPCPKSYSSSSSHSFELFSPQFFEELSLLPPLRFSNIVAISSWPSDQKAASFRSSRDRILSSATLQSLTDLSLDHTFIDKNDLDETSEWLFKMEWMKNIKHLKLPINGLSPLSAFNIASSPHLVNLTSLSFGWYKDSVDQPSVNIILQSPNLSTLTTLTLLHPTPDQIEIITTSPHLNGITALHFQPLLPYLSSIASSKTLCNLQGTIGLVLSDKHYNDPSTLAGLVSFFQSPNIQQLTGLIIIFESPPHNDKYLDLISFVSSPYLKSITNLSISGVEMPEMLRPLFSNPALSNLESLLLHNCQLNDDDIKALASSPYLTHLTRLDLSYNNDTTSQGLSYISQSPNFTNLTELKLARKSEIPFPNKALTELFQSPFITKLHHLTLPGHQKINSDAIKYLMNNPYIFNHYSEYFPSLDMYV